MINITNRRSRLLWQAEIERMMGSLEYSQTKEWTRLFNSQYFKAARLARVGRFDDIDFVIDDARLRMIDTLKKHYRRAATVFSNKAFGILASKKFIQPSEVKTPKEDFWSEINAWANSQAGRKITQLSRTTKGAIAGVIHKGMQEGISHVDIAKNIRKTGAITNSNRARTIALTETHTAAMKSIDSAVKSTRIEMEREWVSARDMRTRRPGKYNIWNHYGKFPNGADGERVPQDKDFVGTGQPLSYPGDPKGAAGNIIRCRCVLLYFTVKKMEKIKPYKPAVSPTTPLEIGDLKDSKPLGGGVNVTNIVGIEHEGKRFKAIFKPVDGESWIQRATISNKKFTLAERENLAYEIDNKLGIGMTPPTVMRDFGKGRGSAQRWIDDASEESGWYGRKLSPEENFKINLFDYIIGNTDRHSGNYLRLKASGNPVLIDHGYSFPDPKMGSQIGLRALRKTGLSEFRRISVTFRDKEISNELRGDILERLKKLKIDKLAGKYNLTKSELAALKERIKLVTKAVDGNQCNYLFNLYDQTGMEDLIERIGK